MAGTSAPAIASRKIPRPTPPTRRPCRTATAPFIRSALAITPPDFPADLAWQYGDGGNRTVTGSPPSLIGATADGTYKNSLNAISFSLGLRF